MDAKTRLQRAQTFNHIAELYDRGRREVPAHVFDDLFFVSGIDPQGANVLEIGCGTGQATLPLARRGCRVTALEMGANLAGMAREKLAAFPLVSIVNCRFEDWQPEGRSFDVVFAANSWHWLDPALKYGRAAAALRPGGVLAFTKANHVFPADCDPSFPAIQQFYVEAGMDRMPWPPPSPDDTPDFRTDIEQSGLFEDIQVIRRTDIESYTADEYIGLMNTASDHRLLDPAKRERLFAEMRRLIEARPEGRILKHNLILLHIARKKG